MFDEWFQYRLDEHRLAPLIHLLILYNQTFSWAPLKNQLQLRWTVPSIDNIFTSAVTKRINAWYYNEISNHIPTFDICSTHSLFRTEPITSLIFRKVTAESKIFDHIPTFDICNNNYLSRTEPNTSFIFRKLMGENVL